MLIELNQEAREKLFKPINGDGGHQAFLQKLQK